MYTIDGVCVCVCAVSVCMHVCVYNVMTLEMTLEHLRRAFAYANIFTKLIRSIDIKTVFQLIETKIIL